MVQLPTVDHDIIIRNKKRSLLCAPHPHSEASLKFVKVWQPTKRKKTSEQSLCAVLNIVYKTLLE